jgi:hypothetical protein
VTPVLDREVAEYLVRFAEGTTSDDLDYNKIMHIVATTGILKPKERGNFI